MKKRLHRCLLWLFLMCKRLLLRPSFAVLLVMIPLCSFAVKLGVSGDSAVLNIGLYSEGSYIGDEIISGLLSRNSIVNFTEYPSEEAARQAVTEDKIQAAWIFPADIGETMDNNAKYFGASALVKVIEREETLSLRLSHELLCGAIHPYAAYSNYRAFAQRKYGGNAPTDDETLSYHYENGRVPKEILQVRVVGEEKQTEINNDFLTLPLRGILSLLCTLCGLACMMLFLSDNKCGVYAKFCVTLRIFPAFASCFSGAVLSSVSMLCAVYLLGAGTNIISELCSMLLFILCVCGFCMVTGLLFGTEERLGAVIPFIMLLMLVQCPVFLNSESFRPLWFLFPPSFYLYAVQDIRYLGYMAVYAVISVGMAFIMNFARSKITHLS